MIRVSTASRLHFGLLSLAADGTERWPNLHGEPTLPVRRFGGVGLMIETPGLQLTAAPGPAWSAVGPLAGRALEYAERFATSLLPRVLPPHHLIVERAPPEHVGLGTGTQLGLAVAQVLARSCGLEADACELARRVGRGARSALGIHGFARGGFLVEAGKGAADTVAPLVAHLSFPEAWRLVLAIAPCGIGLHGVTERQAFEHLAHGADATPTSDTLCRLVLLGMLPALAVRDLAAFGEAVYDFNARVGEAFAPVQGGTYASPRIAELVAFLRRLGVRGVGQSSWGPAVFAVVDDPARAEHLAGRLRKRFGLEPAEVFVTQARNQGALVEDLGRRGPPP